MMRAGIAVVALALVMFSSCSHNTQTLSITGDPTASGVEGTVSADGSRFTTCDGDEIDLGKVGNHTISNTSQPCPAPKFRHRLPPAIKRKAAVRK